MSADAKTEVEKFMNGLKKRNPGEPEFHQAVQEVTETLMPFILEHKQYKDACILERMTEPDRIIIFRVCWEDAEGNIRTNRAWRVQFNNSIGPYKGGMRFHPDVTLSVLNCLFAEHAIGQCPASPRLPSSISSCVTTRVILSLFIRAPF